MRNCTRCNGNGKCDFFGKIKDCNACGGTGTFPDLDEGIIRGLIMATQGKNKGKLRASMVSPLRNDGVTKARAYYVWRLARFHGGVDVTMPMAAGWCIMGDPYHQELEALSDKVAKENFGTNMAAALRWGRAFGMI